MIFLKPEYFWNILWIIPLLVFFWVLSYQRRKKQLSLILGERAVNPAYTTLSTRKRTIRNILLASAILVLLVAAARPSWGTKILPFTGKGRDLLIVQDVSKSMLSQDVQPSRLEHSKWFLRELIKNCTGDRFGIIDFAGTAFLQCPMTADKTTLFQSINEMSVESIPLGGTNIQRAIEASMEAFKAAEGGHRAIILLTDGDELQGSSSVALEELKKTKIPIFVVGIGDPSQPGLIVLPGAKPGEQTFLRDKNGELVKSPLNEKQLNALAMETSGIYVRSTATSTGLDSVLKRVKALIPEQYDQGNQTRPIERFHIPLFAALFLLFAYFAVNERRNVLILLTIMCFANFAGAQDKIPVDDKTQPPMAVNKQAVPGDQLLDTAVPMPDDKSPAKNGGKKSTDIKTPHEIYNKALELQKNKEFDKAAALYENAISVDPGDHELVSKACQNLGVIKHENARALIQTKPEDAIKALESAEEMYRESMRATPKPLEVAMNQQKLLKDRELAKKILEQQKKLEQKKQEAQQKTKEAHDSQKDKNEGKSQQDKKQDQKQDQKNEQNGQQKQKDQQSQKDGKQDKKNEQQDKGGQQTKQDDAQKKTEEAKKSVEDYKEEAKKQDSKQSEESASKAEKEIEKAQEEQKKGNGQKAEENLKNALNELGMSKDEGQNKDKDKQEQKGRQDQDQKNQEKQKAKPQKEQPKDEKEIDPEQAEALLDQMANDEKKLQQEMKEQNKQNSRANTVEKDW
ncbi:MAG: VWA domain-containing protein [Victivallales bacterium]